MKNKKNGSKAKADYIKDVEDSIDFDIEVQNVLQINPIVRKEELIQYLVDKTKISRRTVERRVKNTLKEGKIVKIQSNEFERYGIENTNKRAVYIALKEATDMKAYVDAIFKLLKSKDADDLKLGVRKLRDYQFTYFRRYFIDRRQLNVLTDVLEKSMVDVNLNDDELRNTLLMILFNEITTNHIQPSNKEKFLTTLRQLLDKYPTREFYNKPNNPIPNIIQILGIYRDPKVVERLKEDITTCDQQALRSVGVVYGNKFTAKIIEDSKTDILEFERKLQKESKREILDFLDGVQRQAATTYQDLKRTSEKWLYENTVDNK